MQFERDKKLKSDSGGLSGGSGEGDLDEFLSDLTPSEFYDDNLMRLSGLPWADFVELIEMDNQGWMPSRSVSIISQGMKANYDHHRYVECYVLCFPLWYICKNTKICLSIFQILFLHRHCLLLKQIKV